MLDAFSVSTSIGLQHGVPLEAFFSKYINMRFDPAGLTDDADVRMAQSVMDYLFRRLALDYLPYDVRSELGISVLPRTPSRGSGNIVGSMSRTRRHGVSRPSEGDSPSFAGGFAPSVGAGCHPGGVSKYGALGERLARMGGARLELRFDDVAELVAGGLPSSAYRYPAWWANDPSHVQASSWLNRGFRTEQVDLGARRVVFTRSS